MSWSDWNYWGAISAADFQSTSSEGVYLTPLIENLGTSCTSSFTDYSILLRVMEQERRQKEAIDLLREMSRGHEGRYKV